MRSFLPPAKRSMMGGFLTGIVAVLVFISGLALAGAGVIGALVDSWNASVTGTLTVQIPGSAPDAQTQAQRVAAEIAKLPEIKRAEVVARDRAQAMLKPWLGDEALIAQLPLPTLIDVELAATSTEAMARVTAAIKAVAAQAVIDDHRVWLNRISDFARGLSYVAAALMALCLAALVLTVTFAARASLTEYVHVIEVLHLVGARDGHIAAQFSWRALGQSLWGGLIGLAVFAPTLAVLGWLARRIDAGLMPPVTLTMPYWIGLGALPLVAALIAYVTALSTVRRSLAGMV
jgi:cell division transport system permease protein